jgi:hypothetical protein
MVYISSINGKCYNKEDYEAFMAILIASCGFELISTTTALEMLNNFDRIT